MTSNDSKDDDAGWGFKAAGVIAFIILIICLRAYGYMRCIRCIDKSCSNVEESPGVVLTQPNAEQNPTEPQIILQQPTIHQQGPPTSDARQDWRKPPPLAPPQWKPHHQGHPQWAPRPMGQRQQYSPKGCYDNAAYNPTNAPPPYDTRKY